MSLEELRSDCPINYLLEMVGDKWSLLIIRDILLDAKRSYGQFLESQEHIATNILASRLSSLEKNGILIKKRDPSNRKKFVYSLSEKGLDLLPLFVEIIFWSEKYSGLPVPDDRRELVKSAKKNRDAFISEMKEILRDNNRNEPE